MKAQILAETFSIENVSLSERRDNVFLEIYEGDYYCQVFAGTGNFKCLKVDTKYSANESGILFKISEIFSENEISIFAFTSINYGYFFFEEKFQKLVETSILGKI